MKDYGTWKALLLLAAVLGLIIATAVGIRAVRSGRSLRGFYGVLAAGSCAVLLTALVGYETLPSAIDSWTATLESVDAAQRVRIHNEAAGEAASLIVRAVIFTAAMIALAIGAVRGRIDERIVRLVPKGSVMNEKVLVVLLIVVGALFGVVASQYFPMFGGIEKLGEPWSPARQSLIGEHVLALAVVGGALGFLLLWLRKGRPTPPGEP